MGCGGKLEKSSWPSLGYSRVRLHDFQKTKSVALALLEHPEKQKREVKTKFIEGLTWYRFWMSMFDGFCYHKIVAAAYSQELPRAKNEVLFHVAALKVPTTEFEARHT